MRAEIMTVGSRRAAVHARRDLIAVVIEQVARNRCSAGLYGSWTACEHPVKCVRPRMILGVERASWSAAVARREIPARTIMCSHMC